MPEAGMGPGVMLGAGAAQAGAGSRAIRAASSPAQARGWRTRVSCSPDITQYICSSEATSEQGASTWGGRLGDGVVHPCLFLEMLLPQCAGSHQVRMGCGTVGGQNGAAVSAGGFIGEPCMADCYARLEKTV